MKVKLWFIAKHTLLLMKVQLWFEEVCTPPWVTKPWVKLILQPTETPKLLIVKLTHKHFCFFPLSPKFLILTDKQIIICCFSPFKNHKALLRERLQESSYYTFHSLMGWLSGPRWRRWSVRTYLIHYKLNIYMYKYIWQKITTMSRRKKLL